MSRFYGASSGTPTLAREAPGEWWPELEPQAEQDLDRTRVQRPATDELARTLVEQRADQADRPRARIARDPSAETGRLLRAARGVAEADRRRRFVLFGGWTALWFAVMAVHGGYSWHYFVQGSTLLFDGASSGAPAGGLDLYANYPQLQIGPFTFVVAEGIRLIGSGSALVIAQIVMSAAGLVVLYCVERIVEKVRPELTESSGLRETMLVGGAVFLIGWEDLAVSIGHLDDVLALLCATLAVWAVVAELPAVAGLCVGLSVDAKPWALVFLPLVLAVPKPARRHAAFCTVAVILVAWLPFLVGDWHTLTATQYGIVNEPSSALRALGVDSATTPGWDRIAQISLGCLLGAVAVRRRRWPAVILLGVGARIALDPGVYAYYTAGVLLGALLWDLLGARRPWPLWTLASAAALAIAPMVTSDAALLGELRLGLVVVFTVALLFAPAERHTVPFSRYRPSVPRRYSAGR